jgi:hypothetical protein
MVIRAVEHDKEQIEVLVVIMLLLQVKIKTQV